MKKIIGVLVIIILGLVGYISLAPKKIVTKVVKVPSKRGVKIIKEPIEVVKYDTIIINNVVQRIDKVENKLNKELLKKYEKAKKERDSLQLDNVFKKAITERKYKEQLSDSVIDVVVYSDVIGTLSRQKITYTTKPQEYYIKQKKKRSKMYMGGFTRVGLNGYENIAFGVDLQFVNKKQNKMFKFGYDNQKFVTIGVSFKLF